MRNHPLNPYDVVRWSWYKTWIMAFFHPSVETGQTILYESNISIRQAVVWNGVSGIIYYVLVSLSDTTLKNFQLISLKGAFLFVYYGLIAFVTNILGILLLSGFIHVIAKIFKRIGSFADIYHLFAIINPPVVVLLGLVIFIGQTFSIPLVSFYLLLGIYAMLRLFPLPARVVYRLNWWVAFFITVIIPIAIIFSCCLSFVLIFPSRE